MQASTALLLALGVAGESVCAPHSTTTSTQYRAAYAVGSVYVCGGETAAMKVRYKSNFLTQM